MAETTVSLNTTGMHCSSCAMLIDMTLGDLDGVSESHSDHANGQTVVTFDDAVVDLDSVIAAIRSAGYEASTEE